MNYTINGMPRRAWTGGDLPPNGIRTDKQYRDTVSAFFREALRDCGGLDLWTCAGTSVMDRARMFWNRAKLDAWATVRHARKV